MRLHDRNGKKLCLALRAGLLLHLKLQRPISILIVAFAVGLDGTAKAEQAPATDPVLDRYYSANALYNKKLYALAIQEYETFIKQNAAHPKADMARLGLALSFFGAAKYAEAEPLLAELGRSGKAGEAGQLALMRGQCLMRLNRVADAEKAFESVATGNAAKFKPAAYSAMAEVSFLQNKWPQTIEWADKLPATEGDDAWRCRAAYQAAYASQQLKKYDSAIERLNRLLPCLKDDKAMESQAAFLLGECYRETGRHADAVTAYTAALSNAQESAAVDIQLRIGVAQLELGKPALAAEAFRKTLQMKPGDEAGQKASLYLGRALVETGDLAGAKSALQPLTKPNPRNAVSAEVSLWLARVLTKQNQAKEASDVLGQAIPQSKGLPFQADMYFEAGNLHMEARRYQEAAGCFAAIMEQFPGWPQTNDLWRLQAVCLHHEKKYEASLKLCDDFLARFAADPNRAEVEFVRAENLFLLGRLDQAAPAYAALAAGDAAAPRTDISALRVATIHYRTNAWEKTIAVGEPLLGRKPKGDIFAPLPFLVGDAAFRLEQWDRAVTNLAVFVSQGGGTNKPDNLDTAIMELGVSHMKLARTNEALEQFAAVVGRFPKSRHAPLALSETGRIRYERGELAPARQALEALLKEFKDAPQRPAAEYYLGWIARAEKKNDEAVRRFEAAISGFPNDPLAADAALQRGLLYLAMEKHAEASGAFEQLLQRFPNHPRADLALYSRGIALARTKQWANAVAALQQYREKYPQAENGDRAMYELAWCEKGLNKPAEAIKRYQALIAAYPQSELATKSRTELAELSFDAKDFDKTIADLTQTLEGMTDAKLREEVMYRLGSAHFNKEDWSGAANVFGKFVAEFKSSPLLASACFQAGEAKLRMNEPAAARAHFVAAVAAALGAAKPKQPAADPKVHEAALLRLGETHGLLGEWDDAARASEQFQQQYPKSQYVKLVAFNNGWALENLKKYEEAIKQFRTVVDTKDRDVLSARCQFHIGECLYGLRRYDEALVELVRVQAAYNHAEWTAKSLLEMGRVLEAKGDKVKAQDQFKEVIKRFPKQAEAQTAKERLDAIRMTL